MASKDFLDELIDEGTDRDSKFPAMVDAAYERRQAQKPVANGEKPTMTEDDQRPGGEDA